MMRLVLLPVLLLLSFAWQASTCYAQSFKKGEAIEVYVHEKWCPGTSLGLNPKGLVMAEYEWVRPGQQGVFRKDQVRFAYESGALARGRTWSSGDGAFKIKAALLKVDGDILQLRKPDMTEVRVNIKKLGDSDKAFLTKLEKQLGPIAPTAMEIELFDESDPFSQQVWLQTSRVGISPDPVPASMKMKQAGVAFPVKDSWDRLGGIIPLGGPESGLLAVVEGTSSFHPRPTQLLWASLGKQKIIGQQTLPAGEIVLDYDTASKRLLTGVVDKPEGDDWGKFTLSLWEVAYNDKQPKPIIRWQANPNDRFHIPREPWARLLDGKTVLHRWKDQEYVVWDIAAKRIRYRLTQESFFGAPATLSGGKRYLALPEDKRVRIIEAKSGNLITTLPAENGSSGLAFDPEGAKLAVLDRQNLTVWNLLSADEKPVVHEAGAIGTPFQAQLSWVSPELIAVNGHFSFVLFSLKLQLALWN